MPKFDKTSEALSREATAARSLIDALAEHDETLIEDSELITGSIEDETDLFEAIEMALDEILLKGAIQDGIKGKIELLKKREGQAKARAEKLRGLIHQAMSMAEIKSHVFSSATVTTKALSPKLIITDEASIPSKYWEPQPPKLNKDQILKDLKSGEAIAGAEQSNGGETIQIRVG